MYNDVRKKMIEEIEMKIMAQKIKVASQEANEDDKLTHYEKSILKSYIVITIAFFGLVVFVSYISHLYENHQQAEKAADSIYLKSTAQYDKLTIHIRNDNEFEWTSTKITYSADFLSSKKYSHSLGTVRSGEIIQIPVRFMPENLEIECTVTINNKAYRKYSDKFLFGSKYI